ncbi:MAG: Gfo/Idh/MocA family oxidoreductase [Kiloniellales bacterium]|nr:Gfo/Idh/MocA family oxidoreductase [Kiloniellales bacterium]
MNLYALLQERAAAGKPVTAGLIGAGKFGSMFLAQARATPGLQVTWIADLSVERSRAALVATGWSSDEAAEVTLSEDSDALIAAPEVEVVIEATGNPAAGIAHARAACREGKHIVMVNVEADVLAGPLLAREARRAGLVYSLAYGDQPAMICELVDWARAAGLPVVAAGKGTKYLPAFHASTPDTVWTHFGITPEAAAAGGMNPQMFNSFVDGTKSGIEMAAVANATGLTPAPGGLVFPPCGTEELATVLRPASEGGTLVHKGQVEVISSVQRDGSPVERDLRWGVYVVFEAPSDYTARCFGEYGLAVDPSGRTAAMYKPYHLIGLELGISVLSAALRGESTGAATGFRGDVAAVAKRALKAGEVLDGEGGYTVWGRLMPAADSLAKGALPIGLAHGVELVRDVAEGEAVTWADVALDESDQTLRVRREMEAAFTGDMASAAE